jgi:hypothetical protein
MDPVWADKVAKHGYGIDTTTSTAEELVDYVNTKIYVHTFEDFTDNSLWCLFQEEFEGFTTEDFKKIRTDIRTKLRNHLLRRGVYVATNSRQYSISDALFDLLQEDQQHEWTDDELVETLKVVRPMISIALQDRLNSTMTGLLYQESDHSQDQDQSQTQSQIGNIYRDPFQPNISLAADPQTPTRTTAAQNKNPLPTPHADPSQAAQRTRFAQPTATTPILTVQSPVAPLTQPGETNTTVQTTTHPGYSKELATVAKLYTDDQKYTGVDDSFDFKLTIFHDICNRAGLPPDGHMIAFPTMLKGLAQAHYYNCSLSTKPFDAACTHMRNFFEGPEYYRKNLTEWNAITLQGFIDSNPEKSLLQCLQLLIDKLCKQQHAIDVELRTPRVLTNKLVTACQGVPACRIAISNPSEELATLINKLQSSIVAWEKENPGPAANQTFFTDRRYYHDQNRDRNRGHRPGRYTNDKPKARCYICRKEDCRSWKHTETEREKAKETWRRKFNDNTKGRFANRFEERFKQYIAECEEAEDDEDSEIDHAFESLIMDTNLGSTTAEEQGTTYLTSFGELTHSEATHVSRTLADKAYSHSLTSTDTTKPAPTEDTLSYLSNTNSRYNSDTFRGIVIDTGASTKSTAGYDQFQALQRSNPALELELDTSTKGQVTVQFGVGSASSIGTTNVHTPIGKVQFHIVEASTPFLLCLADMDKLRVYYDNIRDVLVTRTKEVPVVRRYGHAFLLCNSSLQSYLLESFESNPCYLTEVELRRLHRRFGHPSVERLQKLLDRAGHDIDRKTLEHLTKYCHSCQIHGKSLGRFRFTLRDDVNFNYNIIVDIMYISGAPLLHVVDEATRFQTGRWLQDMSAKNTWDVLRMCWIDTYLGPPDTITHDAGKNFVSKEFRQYATTMGITTKGIPVEAHNSIGMVERYHGPLRRAYQIIVTEIPGIDKHMGLQMAFKAINDSAGLNGLVPTLLVFGAYPRMIDSDAPSPTVTQRAAAIRKAMAEVQKLRAERQIADALNMRNGPRTNAVHELPPNSPVLVWREGNTGQSGYWDGPFTLLTVEGETCTVKLNSGPTTFRSTVVKPYLQSEPDEDEHTNEQTDYHPTPENQNTTTPEKAAQPAKRGRGRPRKYPQLETAADVTIYLQDDNQFKTSRQKELTGLLEKGVFEIVRLDDIPEDTRLFNSRFVDEVKNAGTSNAFEKSRLVVQAYNDQEKDIVLTQSPTIQRVSQRLILCIAAMGHHTLYLRDISQAYVQSTTNLNREFYVRPPQELKSELGLDEDSVLKVLKPLYGVPEAGNHWFKTYHSHHINQLHMDQSTYDPCLLQSNEPFGIVGIQTDDTLFLADEMFAEAEQNELRKAKFLAKEREQLTANTPIKFNGGLIQLTPDGITLTQERQCKNVKLIDIKTTTSTSSRGITRTLAPKDQYIAQRARGAYIASMCQPEASFDLSFAAQVTNPNEDDAKALNKRLDWQMKNPKRGLKFVKLDTNSLQLLVFTDASFANNKDLSSQIGYVIVLTDATRKANILHWSSVKCKRVTRSVLASELYGMAHGFDISTAIKSTIDKILQIDLPLVLCTDSKSLYDCLVRLGTTQEKRLMIDVMCLRQAYERRLVTEVKWIDGGANPADAMTKGKPCPALTQLIDTNEIDLRAVGWVERV